MTSSVDSICKKRTPSSSDGDVAHLSESEIQSDPARHVSPVVAHELNNILAIVQGYADRLLIKYADDTALQSQLKMITEAARRAATIIREATPQPEPDIA
jgi:signal transduction histidine kinase